MFGKAPYDDDFEKLTGRFDTPVDPTSEFSRQLRALLGDSVGTKSHHEILSATDSPIHRLFRIPNFNPAAKNFLFLIWVISSCVAAVVSLRRLFRMFR